MFSLGAIAEAGGSEPILPAYLVGMVLAGTFLRERPLVLRLRAMAFTILTPFYFIRAGTFVSARAVLTGAGVIGLFLLVKLAAKYVGVRPLTGLFRFPQREAMYTTLLMSTGLTFGTISALYGLTHGIIDRDKYTVVGDEGEDESAACSSSSTLRVLHRAFLRGRWHRWRPIAQGACRRPARMHASARARGSGDSGARRSVRPGRLGRESHVSGTVARSRRR
jgi:Kef-type K+ transport system membrane component KefB